MVSDSIADVALLVGRVLYGATLAMMASAHFMKVKDMAGYAGMKKVPAPKIAVLGSGTVLLLGALSILAGAFVEIGVALIAVFFVPITLMMHNFWADTDPMMKMNNQANFMKNTVILGAALMFLSIPEPWAFSIG